MADSMHLIERAAERLRAESGIADPMSPAPPSRRPATTPVAGGAENAPGIGPSADSAERLPREFREASPNELASPATVHAGEAGGDGLGAVAIAAMPSPSAAKAANAVETTTKPLDISVLERGGLVVGRKSRTRISEEFRIAVGHVLRNLQTSYTAGHGSANLIMVTSSRPGEGKSFTAMNLAGCIAQQNQREVLLVDIDAKQRPVTFELGLGDAPGLLDLVRDPGLRIEDVIVPTAIPSLSFIPIGARMASNAEMPLSRPISAMVERLGRRFANRVIILDAPPCLSTSDPSALAPTVGQVLMVVEAERTQRNELVAALELVRVCPTITLLLNKIQLTTSYTFGAYHYFGTYS